MKKALMAAAALVALPVMAQAQSPSPGVYIGAEGGVNWLLNFNANTNLPIAPVVGVTPSTGWMAGGVIGYDFVGPRVELEGIYRWNGTNIRSLSFSGMPGPRSTTRSSTRSPRALADSSGGFPAGE